MMCNVLKVIWALEMYMPINTGIGLAPFTVWGGLALTMVACMRDYNQIYSRPFA